jgi:hypothetical protein
MDPMKGTPEKLGKIHSAFYFQQRTRLYRSFLMTTPPRLKPQPRHGLPLLLASLFTVATAATAVEPGRVLPRQCLALMNDQELTPPKPLKTPQTARQALAALVAHLTPEQRHNLPRLTLNVRRTDHNRPESCATANGRLYLTETAARDRATALALLAYEIGKIHNREAGRMFYLRDYDTRLELAHAIIQHRQRADRIAATLLEQAGEAPLLLAVHLARHPPQAGDIDGLIWTARLRALLGLPDKPATEGETPFIRKPPGNMGCTSSCLQASRQVLGRNEMSIS